MRIRAISIGMAIALACGARGGALAPRGSLAEILDDDRGMLIDLGLQQLTTLEKHLMDEMKLSAGEREAFGAIEISKLLEKPQEIQGRLKIVEDSGRLLEIGRLLTEKGTQGARNLLEYWPANSKTQARTLPLAMAIDQICVRAGELAKQRSREIENAITAENQEALGAAWERQQNLISLANYRRAFNLLTVGLCMDKADPKRAESLKTATELLAPFLDEKFNVQNSTRIAIGKMRLFSGDIAGAVEIFRQAIKDAGASKEQVFEAFYFSLVADGESDVGALKKWIGEQYAQGTPQRKSMEAAMALLEYRRVCDKADRAGGDAKAALNRQAMEILDRLADQREDLGGVIFEQMLARMPERPDLSTLSPRMLLAAAQRAIDVSERENPSREVMEQGAAAVERLLGGEISDETRSLALLMNAQLLVKMGRAQAALGALRVFLEKYPRDLRATNAIEFASALLSQEISDDARVGFYKIVTAAPYLKNEHNLGYAQLLLKRNIALFAVDYSTKRDGMIADARLAMELCEKCPKADEARGKFNGLIARDQLLDLLPEKERGELWALTLAQADVILVQKKADAESRLIAAKTLLIRSGLATHFQGEKRGLLIEQNLEMLKEMEALTANLPEGKALVVEARLARVHHLIELGRASEALDDLGKILSEGERGLNAALGALNAVNLEYQSAVVGKDEAKIKTLAIARAATANLLAESAGKMEKFPARDLAQYREFAAEASLAASVHEPDAAKRKAILTPAIGFYEGRQKEFPGEPKWTLKLAMASYELPDYSKAQPLLSKLISDKSLGSPQTFDEQGKASWNEAYWDATYKLLKCEVELARGKTPGYDLGEAKAYLNKLYVLWTTPGGEKWAGRFEALKKEMD